MGPILQVQVEAQELKSVFIMITIVSIVAFHSCSSKIKVET